MEDKKRQIKTRIADEGDFGNSLSFVGNLGHDPEMSYTPEGKAVTKFSVGVWAGKGITLWLKTVVWEALAEEAVEVLQKGMRVKVVGRLRSYKWQGADRYEVIGSWIEILTKKPDLPADTEVGIVEDTTETIGSTPF